MSEDIFSKARLYQYRLLENAGVGDGEELHILNTTLAAQLWLPYSLIEVAFRNHVDNVVSSLHPQQEDWFVATGRRGDLFIATQVTSALEFRVSRRDGSNHDPVSEAAEAASTVPPRLSVTRDDLIAHLMLGFWVNRCADALGKQGYSYYDIISEGLPQPLNDGLHLRKTMRDHVLSMRNRVAHHEPVLFRKRHLFNKDGTERTPSDILVNAAQGALPNFRKEVMIAIETAEAFVPVAAKPHLREATRVIDEALKPLEERVSRVREELRKQRQDRIAARETQLRLSSSDAA